jgi:hypothetical protein
MEEGGKFRGKRVGERTWMRRIGGLRRWEKVVGARWVDQKPD